MQHLLDAVPTPVRDAHPAQIALLHATRALGAELVGAKLCDALVAANTELVEAVEKDAGGERLLIYAGWVESWVVEGNTHTPEAAAVSEVGTTVGQATKLDGNLVRSCGGVACVRRKVWCGPGFCCPCPVVIAAQSHESGGTVSRFTQASRVARGRASSVSLVGERVASFAATLTHPHPRLC